VILRLVDLKRPGFQAAKKWWQRKPLTPEEQAAFTALKRRVSIGAIITALITLATIATAAYKYRDETAKPPEPVPKPPAPIRRRLALPAPVAEKSTGIPGYKPWIPDYEKLSNIEKILNLALEIESLSKNNELTEENKKSITDISTPILSSMTFKERIELDNIWQKYPELKVSLSVLMAAEMKAESP